MSSTAFLYAAVAVLCLQAGACSGGGDDDDGDDDDDDGVTYTLSSGAYDASAAQVASDACDVFPEPAVFGAEVYTVSTDGNVVAISSVSFEFADLVLSGNTLTWTTAGTFNDPGCTYTADLADTGTLTANDAFDLERAVTIQSATGVTCPAPAGGFPCDSGFSLHLTKQ